MELWMQYKSFMLTLESLFGTLNLYKHLQFIVCGSQFVQVFILGFPSPFSKYRDQVQYNRIISLKNYKLCVTILHLSNNEYYIIKTLQGVYLIGIRTLFLVGQTEIVDRQFIALSTYSVTVSIRINAELSFFQVLLLAAREQVISFIEAPRASNVYYCTNLVSSNP